ncbi:hypothetical protein SAMN05444266_109155 [Chitinophaga jiangningensis]|uniref:Uncharacterized protein n=1 Tax=Chitinophaga jiangningensis TaxID=1419482 RepID=A0A1M7K4Y2_9BACT|nr:hypothetical protein [Chitinophaga jiangningensis]SHM60316.1 hypothetical protein SAMN05444266_109155 [Chitinophaga jiangningensis]
MKKTSEKKLHLGKIKVAELGKKVAGNSPALFSISIKISCISQGAPICSEDSCRF